MHKYEIQRLHDLCFDIVDASFKNVSKTTDVPIVFYYLFGHTSNVEIRVFEHGWEADMKCDREFNLETDKPTGKEYRQAISYLTSLKKKTV